MRNVLNSASNCKKAYLIVMINFTKFILSVKMQLICCTVSKRILLFLISPALAYLYLLATLARLVFLLYSLSTPWILRVVGYIEAKDFSKPLKASANGSFHSFARLITSLRIWISCVALNAFLKPAYSLNCAASSVLCMVVLMI